MCMLEYKYNDENVRKMLYDVPFIELHDQTEGILRSE